MKHPHPYYLPGNLNNRCRTLAEHVTGVRNCQPDSSSWDNLQQVEKWLCEIVLAGWTLGALHDGKIGFLRRDDYKLVEIGANYDGVRYFADEVAKKEGRAA